MSGLQLMNRQTTHRAACRESLSRSQVTPIAVQSRRKLALVCTAAATTQPGAAGVVPVVTNQDNHHFQPATPSTDAESASSNGSSSHTPNRAVVSPAVGLHASPSPSHLPPPASAKPQIYDGIISQPPARRPGLLVRVRGMVKHFNTPKGVFKAVNNVDVDIEPGSIVALLGPSGSGKTTLLRLVAGLEEPTEGRIFFDDVDATNTSVQDRQIGFVFQSYALFNHKTVAENIKFGLEVRKMPGNHNTRASDLLDLVQLQGLGDRFPRQLSGGQRQRVALARALASNPKLLLLDEPFGALDAVVRKQLRAGLKEIVKSVGVTTIIVTHDQEEAFDLADRVVIFNRGNVEQQGSPNDIIEFPRTPFIMKFVGETCTVPASSLVVKRVRFQTLKSDVMFRPQDLQIHTTSQEGEEKPTTPAMVAQRQNLGWLIKYTLRFDDGVECEFPVTRERDLLNPLDVGSRLHVYVDPTMMMGFDPDDIDSTPKL